MASIEQCNTLVLVPGEVLFRDRGKKLSVTGKWVKTMCQMTAEQQEMRAEADVLVREWRGLYVKDKSNGRAQHNLMLETTIEGVGPSERLYLPRQHCLGGDGSIFRLDMATHITYFHAAETPGHITVISDSRALYDLVEKALKDIEIIGKMIWTGGKI